MATPEEALREKLKKLFALLGSDNPHERDTTRRKIDEVLAQNKKTWNDLMEILSDVKSEGWREGVEDNVDGEMTRKISPLDLVHHMFQRYLRLNLHEYVAASLWVLHTFVYDRFSVTPRLAFVSPVRGCGKTTALSIIKNLAAEPIKADHITAAAMFRLVNRKRPTLLLDEVDNLNLLNNATLRAVLNSGHTRDGRVVRYTGQEVTEFSTFAPAALAVIGKLPLPLSQRCVVIRMERKPAAESIRFDELNEVQRQDFDTVYREIIRWTEQCKLNPNPPIPEGLHNRQADNWRVLLSVADACGAEWGTVAREVAVAMGKAHRDEDAGVTLLSDIRDCFDRRPTIDRLTSLTSPTGRDFFDFRGV